MIKSLLYLHPCLTMRLCACMCVDRRAFLYGVLIVYTQVVAEIMVDLLRGWDRLPFEDDGRYFDNRRLFVLIFGFGIFL